MSEAQCHCYQCSFQGIIPASLERKHWLQSQEELFKSSGPERNHQKWDETEMPVFVYFPFCFLALTSSVDQTLCVKGPKPVLQSRLVLGAGASWTLASESSWSLRVLGAHSRSALYQEGHWKRTLSPGKPKDMQHILLLERLCCDGARLSRQSPASILATQVALEAISWKRPQTQPSLCSHSPYRPNKTTQAYAALRRSSFL